MMRVSIDAGGTTTRVRVNGLDSVFQSLNPASGRGQSIEGVLRFVRTRVEGCSEIVVGSASYSGSTVSRDIQVWSDAARATGIQGTVWLMNDVWPLVLGEPGRACASLVLGTGSASLCVYPEGQVRRVGGNEWIASDEGSGSWMGRRVLQALTRCADGRDSLASSHLADAVAMEVGMGFEAAAREFAEMAFPKRSLASLAPVVLRLAYSEGDELASAIVREAVEEISCLIAPVVGDDLYVEGGRWYLTGGLLSNEGFANDVVDVVRDSDAEASISVVEGIDIVHQIEVPRGLERAAELKYEDLSVVGVAL